MIHHIEGSIFEKTPAHVVLETNGIGYNLQISLNTFSKIGESPRCKLFVEQLYIRDDIPKYYGFFDGEERDLFRQLVSVSGVGGTSAILMLSSLSAIEIQNAIATGNVTLLKGVKGIGEKTAQRIIVDLKGKIGKTVSAGEFILSSTNNILKEEALSALVMLGFNKTAADKVLDKVIKTEGTGQTVEQLIKSALKNL